MPVCATLKSRRWPAGADVRNGSTAGLSNPYGDENRLDVQTLTSDLELPTRRAEEWVHRLFEDADTPRARKQVLEQRQILCGGLEFCLRVASDVTAGSRKARNDVELHWIADGENDRNCACSALRSQRGRRFLW